MKRIYNILRKENVRENSKNPPIWIMRQAGRYLPEYREIRANVSNFLELCYNPKLASEVTLQPIRRFDFDAAIIFSDILVIPDSLGLKVEFVKNEGPKLSKISSQDDLKNFKIGNVKNHLQPVFETLALTKQKLAKDKTLIGFSGAPFTLACYMIEGGGSKNFDLVRQTAIKNEEFFAELINILTDEIVEYLSLQINAGADVVKLFDSWAGILTPSEFQKWVIAPAKKIVAKLRQIHPTTPIIYFPRGCGALYENFAKSVKCDAIAIDQNVPKLWAAENLQNHLGVVLQGNLDNQLLAYGSKTAIENEVKKIREIFGQKAFIFNLGHGILPQTPIENVELLVKLLRQ